MEEQASVPRTHSANEPTEPTKPAAGSDGIEETTEEDDDSPWSNTALCDCSLILLRVR